MRSLILSDSFLLIESALFSVVCLVIAIYLSVLPTLIGMAVTVAALTLYYSALKVIGHRHRKAQKAGKKADALLYQFTAGVIKMRMAGAEERATLEYLRPVSQQAEYENRNARYRCFFESLSIA